MKETASLKQRVMMPATKRVRRSLLTMLKILMDKMISLRVRVARKAHTSASVISSTADDDAASVEDDAAKLLDEPAASMVY